jgi:iron-sulfur cluster assembly accessory protein
METAMSDTSAGQTALPGGVLLTETAARRIREVMAGEAEGGKLRVSVDGGGCSGFQYVFGIEPAQKPDDMLIERDGASVLIDPVSFGLLSGSTIDFVDDLVGQSFRITNPNATSSCGCGTSFSL